MEVATSPLPPGEFERAVQRATAACQPFGPGADVAHAGPVGPGSFVHFDLGRTWSEAGGIGSVSLVATTLHELGHVLGLGHVGAAEAVMGVDPERPMQLSRHELAGLHSLYGGGGERGPGDLAIVRAGVELTVLRSLAPASTTDFALFDADGDGRDDLVTWRTDDAGHGELLLCMFDAGPRLARTVGPFPGVVAPGCRVGFVLGATGERLLIATATNGKVMPRQFDRHGVPELPAQAVAAALAARATTVREGDLDGDGRRERVERSPAR
jgi:hypothetical protein